ncbi:MAG TPA: branched-chain amino acid ABC transporter permease, partial [Pyrodictium sp.]|nr:branched-chain amino acid ABC transporter permease [Pyrodictium sp.]
MDLMVLVSATIDGILMGLVYGLVALGLALIWGVMNIINFAHGDYMVLGAYIAVLLSLIGVDAVYALPLAFAIVYLVGVATYKFVIKRVLNAPFVSQIAATFALLLLIRYGVELVAGPRTWIVESILSGNVVQIGPLNIEYSKLFAGVVSIAVFAMVYLFLTRTYTGLAARAIAQNRSAAMLQGIDVDRVNSIVFGLGVGVAGLAGALVALVQPVFPELGGFYCLVAFISVVLGGFTSVVGSFLGAIIIGLSESLS